MPTIIAAIRRSSGNPGSSAVVVIVVCALAAICTRARGQGQLTEPIYRVANETAAAQPAAPLPAAAPAANATPASRVVLDFTQQPGEHPLAPAIRVCKASLEEIDRNVRDYSCTLVKRERVDGELGEHQHILLKVRHEPFSVYMNFLKPFQGREVVYVDGQNNNKLIVLEAGWKRVAGKLPLDPNGARAMNGQKHPITKVGIRNLTAALIRRMEADIKYSECEVLTKDEKIGDRPATMVQVIHPIPRQNFDAHIARVFFDNELGIPIHYDSFLWPQQQGGQPPLDESFTYMNLKINNGFTPRDFDAYNNPEIFQ
ncbi:MAG TPA: DUF1571 domain-containing protein [Lacipirellulaceae bacterium]|jgi:hypothetical protein|nr:DUF1571 domain-containing protein [Lacipirellulaceae bacterium]